MSATANTIELGATPIILVDLGWGKSQEDRALANSHTACQSQ